MIVSPEYNASMPGLLKNLIDWTSRFRPQPFDARHALLLSASPSLVGGNRGLWSLRVPLEMLNVRVFPSMFSLSKAKRFDLGRYPRDQVRSVRFDRPGVVRVFCDIHSHMSAFILVFAHPYFDVTEPDGSYRIDRVPAGSYSLVAWNEGHITPSAWRHTPAPTQSSTARARLPSRRKAKTVSTEIGRVPGVWRRSRSTPVPGAGSTLPGLSRPAGSKATGAKAAPSS